MKKLSELSRSIDNKVVLITGATSGMGLATAKLFSDQDAQVIVTDLNKEKVNEVVKEISSYGKKCYGIKLDVTNLIEIKTAVAEIVKLFGGIDILINNAGISIPTLINDENYEEYWDKTFNVLLKAQVQLIRETLPYIQKSESGRIVNISSTEGLGATPRQSPYTSAKHGVIAVSYTHLTLPTKA